MFSRPKLRNWLRLGRNDWPLHRRTWPPFGGWAHPESTPLRQSSAPDGSSSSWNPPRPKLATCENGVWYALHNGVPDTFGTGGEVFVSGQATLIDDPEPRTVAAELASYQPEDRYILFELAIAEARCNSYGDVPLPDPSRWMQ